MNSKYLNRLTLTSLICLSASCQTAPPTADQARIQKLESQVESLIAQLKSKEQLTPEKEPEIPIPADTCKNTGVGDICTVAGNGIAGYNGDHLNPRATAFYSPQGVYVNPANKNLYVVDFNNHRVRKLDPSTQKVSTIMGSGFLGDKPLLASDPMVDALKINLNHPTGLTMDMEGNLVLAAWHNWKVKFLNKEGKVGVLAGKKTNAFSGDGGPATDAHLNFASSAISDFEGNFYISDQGNRRIRKLDTEGIIKTFAGTGEMAYGGDGGPALEAKFNLPAGSNAVASGKLALHPHGDLLYIADTFNHRVRVIDLKTGIINTVAGKGTSGYSGDGGLATEAELNEPVDVAVAEDHSIYIADTGNHSIRKISPSGTISTVAGNGKGGFSGDGSLATKAELDLPSGIFVDDEYLYIADTNNHRIRRVTLHEKALHHFSSTANIYTQQCSQCHEKAGEGGSGIPLKGNYNCESYSSIKQSIDEQMPKNNHEECTGLCARDMAFYLLSEFNGLNCD